MTTVFLFPGQSSRYPEMIERLLSSAPQEASPVLDVASELVGRDLAAQYRPSNPSIFATNRDVQLGVFLASHIHLLAAERAGLRAELSLGLSLGEYNHLVHIGALRFADAVRLVDARGAAYDAGPPGAMASVFPLPYEDLLEVVERVRAHGALEIANLNSPTQNVISGERAAIDAAACILDAEHGVECVIIEERIAMHSTLFRPVADGLEGRLFSAPWKRPERPYLPNILGDFEPHPTPARIASLLARHVYGPVHFRASIERVLAQHPDAAFVEVGPRSVLYNLLSRRWVQNRRFRTDGGDGPGPALETTARALEAQP